MHAPHLMIFSSSVMDKKPVLFLDSGVGGIPYCRNFLRRNPAETICYLADRRNFPYGTRGREELAAILAPLMEKLVSAVNPKIAVLACNTATVSALAELRLRFPGLLFVGTVPAVKPAMQASKTGKVGVLGTARTIEDPYIHDLAGGACEIYGVAAPELVEFVEKRFFIADEKEKCKMAGMFIEPFRTAGADTLVLGCTHFLFLLDEFRREAAPSIKVFDSIDGITQRIESLLDDNGGALRAAENIPHENLLLLTGTEALDNMWQNLAEQLGFRLSLLDEL
jgi:glutamate racemase